MQHAPDTMEIAFELNGDPVRITVNHDETLLDALRLDLELTGSKRGCGEGECGACSVILNDRVVNSCLVLAAECDGAKVITVEGLARGGKLHPIQDAFIRSGAVQCGFCTPGMIMAAYDLVSANSAPTEADVRRALEGNLCRCTGYRKIIDAVLSVSGGVSDHD